nr:ribonuclease H-like domain-containing protein [Tanacetum cinerariifolium]
MEAIKKRFGGNKETKKVQKTLLKQQYENFTGSSSESLDQIHERPQKLISQLEILGESLSQEDINLNFLRSLPTEWRTHTLIWRNKTNLEEQSLDDLFNSLKIYEAKVKSSSFASTSTQNIAFVSSQNIDNTNELVSAVASVSAACAKILVSALPNVDTLSNARTGRNLRENRPTSMGFDMSKVECYNCHRKGHFARECRSPKDTRRNVAAKPKRRNVPVETSTSNKAEQERDDLKLKLEKFQMSSKNLSHLLASQINDKTGLDYNTQVFTSSMFNCDEIFSSKTDESLPSSPKYDRYHSGDGYHDVSPPYTRTFMPPKPDLVFHNAPNVNETVHTAFNVELSLTKPDKELSHRPSTPIIKDWVSDSEDDSEAELPQNAPSFVQPTKQVKTLRPSVKPVENSTPAANPNITIPKLKSHGNNKNRKAGFMYKSLTHLIKDLLTKSKLVPLTSARQVTTAVSPNNVTRPRPAKTVVTKPYLPPRRNINRRPSPKASTFPPKVIAAKAPMINVVKGVQGNWVWKPKCPILDHVSRHTSASMTLKRFDYNDALGRSKEHVYLSDVEEINSGYVAFSGNPNGGKISSKSKIRTGKLDFDDVYFVNELKFNLFSVSQMCNKKNNALFTDTKYIVLSPEFKLPDENQVLLRVPRENNMYNVDLKNIVSSRDLTCLIAKATLDESNLLHRRLGHINFKTMNNLVKVMWDEGDKKEFSVPRTPQQNGIAERKNKTIIEAARTMLADSLLPISFWAEAVNTACYV